jgi:hypothetical protein
MTTVHLCVAPDGSLELWHRYGSIWCGRYFRDGLARNMYQIFAPAFWGREVIDEWQE